MGMEQSTGMETQAVEQCTGQGVLGTVEEMVLCTVEHETGSGKKEKWTAEVGE